MWLRLLTPNYTYNGIHQDSLEDVVLNNDDVFHIAILVYLLYKQCKMKRIKLTPLYLSLSLMLQR